MRRAERGQVVPIVAAVLVVAAVVALVVGELGVAAVHRAQARTAADAAALAGAAEGEAAARSVAADNGAELVSFVRHGLVVEVVVRYRHARARATAEGTPAVADGVAPVDAAAADAGLCRQAGSTGPVSFGPCPPTDPGSRSTPSPSGRPRHGRGRDRQRWSPVRTSPDRRSRRAPRRSRSWSPGGCAGSCATSTRGRC